MPEATITINDVPILGSITIDLTQHSINKVALSSIAGLFDGEGSISQSGGTELQLRISNSDMNLLTKAQETIGGTIQGGKMYQEGANVPIYSLVLAPARSKVAANLLLPFSYHIQKQKVLALLATFPELETGNKRATDIQIQSSIRHLNAVCLVNSPKKLHPHS